MTFEGSDYLDLAKKAEAEAARAPTLIIQNQWQILAREYLRLAQVLEHKGSKLDAD